MLRRILVLIIAGVLYLPFLNLAQAQDVYSSIEVVISDPDNFDGKLVTVQGEVEKLKHYNSPSGDTYTLFRLIDDERNSVNVYKKGRLEIAKGDKLRVIGKFREEKRYAFFKFKNVIKAKSVEDATAKEEQIAQK